MEEKNKDVGLSKVMSDVECYSVEYEKDYLSNYIDISMDKVSTFGTNFLSLITVLKQIVKTGKTEQGEPLYRLILPRDLKSSEKLYEKNGIINGNIISKKTKRIADRANFEKVSGVATKTGSVHPAVILIAIAISVITKKLDNIYDAQKEIIEYLKLKEKANLRGNVIVLEEILENYKYNTDNDKYKTNKHIQVQEIKRDAEKSIVFCQELVTKHANKRKLIKTDKNVKEKMEAIKYEFKDYELSLYIFAFASFLEVMLLENFSVGYLKSVYDKICKYADNYKKISTQCFEIIQAESHNTVQSIAVRGAAGFNKGIGKVISKVPKIKDGQVDEKLLETSSKISEYNENRIEDKMKEFTVGEVKCISPFIENIKVVNAIYNEPTDILFDDENIYVSIGESEE